MLTSKNRSASFDSQASANQEMPRYQKSSSLSSSDWNKTFLEGRRVVQMRDEDSESSRQGWPG